MKAQKFEIPQWIVNELGMERTQRCAREAIRSLKAEGIGFAQGVSAVLDILEAEADFVQRARLLGGGAK